MNEVRPDLPKPPNRIAKLPVNHQGYPVPWFVAWIDGKPDFRIIGENKIAIAHNEKRCWLCGEPRGKYLAFVIGPMCAINRISSEPPSHRECAEYAAIACPFLTRPKVERRANNLPIDETLKDRAGIAIERNPGVALVWITKSYRPFRVSNGVLFQVGDPVETLWFTHGRRAVRGEVLDSIDSGFPILQELARQEGSEAISELNRKLSSALTLLPVC